MSSIEERKITGKYLIYKDIQYMMDMVYAQMCFKGMSALGANGVPIRTCDVWRRIRSFSTTKCVMSPSCLNSCSKGVN